MDYIEHSLRDGRLVILRALGDQNDYRLNETLLTRALESCGHNWTREKVRDQLRWLGEMGALSLSEAGTVMIAAITRRGLDHVHRRVVIEGVHRPSPEV